MSKQPERTPAHHPDQPVMAVAECRLCTKRFLNQAFLEQHVLRKHPTAPSPGLAKDIELATSTGQPPLPTPGKTVAHAPGPATARSVSVAAQKEELRRRIAELEAIVRDRQRPKCPVQPSPAAAEVELQAPPSASVLSSEALARATGAITSFDLACTEALDAASDVLADAQIHTNLWVAHLFGESATHTCQQAGSLLYGGGVPWSDIDCAVHLNAESAEIIVPTPAESYPTTVRQLPPRLLRLTGAPTKKTKSKKKRGNNVPQPSPVLGGLPTGCHVDVWLENRPSISVTGDQHKRALRMKVLMLTNPNMRPLLRALKGALWHDCAVARGMHEGLKSQMRARLAAVRSRGLDMKAFKQSLKQEFKPRLAHAKARWLVAKKASGHRSLYIQGPTMSGTVLFAVLCRFVQGMQARGEGGGMSVGQLFMTLLQQLVAKRTDMSSLLDPLDESPLDAVGEEHREDLQSAVATVATDVLRRIEAGDQWLPNVRQPDGSWNLETNLWLGGVATRVVHTENTGWQKSQSSKRPKR